MSENKNPKAYLVGGGIASLSAAVYLIQDGNFKGENITIFDESEKLGGALDAQNTPESVGYIMRGIRVFEEKTYTCSFDLMTRIPSLNSPGKNLREEFIEYNDKNKSYSKSRLLKHGEAVDGRPLLLNIKDRLGLITLLLSKETSLENKKISEYFTPSFFTSNFWYEFCTIFAFQPWHSVEEFRRYFLRFIQSFPGIDSLEGMENSPFNQYEFLVLPILEWLKNNKVVFTLDSKVTDIEFDNQNKIAKNVKYVQFGEEKNIAVEPYDYVFTTIGSITANSSLGSMDKAPALAADKKDASWKLWESISRNKPEFGKPSVFNNEIEKTKWTSFTITFRDPTFFNLIEKFIHRKVTVYGGVHLIESNWLMSIALSYKPYFLDQPKNVNLCWGYGLYPEKEGNFVKKKMSECTGEEILTELLYHLGFEKHLDVIIKNSVCIPCLMPYITSQFMPRKKGDRPKVIPNGATNFAFLGQYVEIPDDVVFTVEYSVRSAQIAVYSLLGLHNKVSPIYRGTHHLGVLYRAFKTILR